jgi:DNA-binding beta-propeller fold protein YncE
MIVSRLIHLMTIALVLVVLLPTAGARSGHAQGSTPAAGSGPVVELVDNFDLGVPPSGIAFDPSGNLQVIDPLNDRIQVVDSTGAVLATWGETGTGPGQFRFHESEQAYYGDLDIDADGNIYVFDIFNHRVQKFDAERTFLLEWGGRGVADGELDLPGGAVDDATGRVYVADYGNHRIQVFDADGRFLDAWGSFGSGEGQLNAPADVAIGPDGTLYVVEKFGARVQHFTPDGTVLGSIGAPGTGPGQFGDIYSAAVDDTGVLYVADYANNRIQVFGPDGAVAAIVDEVTGAGALTLPLFVALDAEGFLYVAEEGADRVLKLRLLPPLAPAGAGTPVA